MFSEKEVVRQLVIESYPKTEWDSGLFIAMRPPVFPDNARRILKGLALDGYLKVVKEPPGKAKIYARTDKGYNGREPKISNRKEDPDTTGLTSLKASADNNEYAYSNPDASVLETFAIPDEGLDYVEFTIEEFTSLCGMTGQPDYGEVYVYYVPRHKCVESKSVKQYSMQYRNHKAFAETTACMIKNDLAEVLEPHYLTVTVKFTPRGGISFSGTAIWK